MEEELVGPAGPVGEQIELEQSEEQDELEQSE